MITSNESALVKILFRLDPGSVHGASSETLWAREMGKNLYRLENSPFYAYGVSFNDIVEGQQEDYSIVFKGVVRLGGHSTYRIIVNPDQKEKFKNSWQPLQEIGCTFEEGLQGLYSVDVPPETDIHAAYALFEEGERNGVWSFEEGHCGHLDSLQSS